MDYKSTLMWKELNEAAAVLKTLAAKNPTKTVRRRKNADTSDGFFDEGDKPRSPEPIKTVRDDSGIITELELSDNPSAI